MTKTRFVFFDLGNVLLRFSLDRLARQGAEVTGRTPEDIMRAVFASGMQRKIETGQATEKDFYESFCNELGVRPEPEVLAKALNDIFTEVDEIKPFLHTLSKVDFPRGILSNTGPGHWNHCCQTYPFLLRSIPTNHILSYQVGYMKPDPRIYQAAFDMAQGVIPGIRDKEILFIDDLEPNVLAARVFGLDAVQFVTEHQLVTELAKRGFSF